MLTLSRKQADRPIKLIVHCDESCENFRYLGLGASVTRVERSSTIMGSIAAYRHEHRMLAELKWSKVTNQKELEYRALIDMFFALNNANMLHFHALFSDTHKFNHKKFNESDSEMGIYKLYYQLLIFRVARVCKNAQVHVIIDERHTNYSLSLLKTILNNGARKEFGFAHDVFRSVEPGVSHKNDMMQLHDVILGAVTTRRNGNHLIETTRIAKKNLSEHVLAQSGLRSYEYNTPPSNKRFSIWNFQLSN